MIFSQCFCKKVGVISCLLAILFISTSKAASLADAADIYFPSYKDYKEGVHATEELVFVIVDIENKFNSSSNSLKAKSMLRSFALLQDYAKQEFFKDETVLQKKENKILSRWTDLREAIRTAKPSFGKTDIEISVPLRIMEDKKYDNNYRYAIALEKDALKKALPLTWPVEPTEEMTITALREAVKLSIENDDVESMLILARAIGAYEDLFLIANEETVFDGMLLSFPRVPVIDTTTLFYDWQEATDLLSSKEFIKKQELYSLAKSVQGFIPIIKKIAGKWRDEGKLEEAITFYFMASGNGDGKNIPAELFDCIDELNAVWSEEYKQLVMELDASENPFAKNENNIILRRVWQTQGHISMSSHWNNNITDEYISAEALYKKGKDLPRIINLLSMSIKNSPLHTPSWRLLGEALLVNGETKSALVVLCQANRMNKWDSVTKTKLALCYEKLGYINLARSMALASLTCEDTTNQMKDKAFSILENNREDAIINSNNLLEGE